MTDHDRVVVLVINQLVIDWHWPQEKQVYFGMLRQHLPKASQGPGMTPLVEAGHALLTAEGPVEWAASVNKATRALATVQRSALGKLIEKMRAAEAA
jgi:hypothetical protein